MQTVAIRCVRIAGYSRGEPVTRRGKSVTETGCTHPLTCQVGDFYRPDLASGSRGNPCGPFGPRAPDGLRSRDLRLDRAVRTARLLYRRVYAVQRRWSRR
ncbi:MAG: hypothetical protein QOE83_41 [Actinomycetota bacterium]|nr:hypothetical protein [Actinomycetota bacterium]